MDTGLAGKVVLITGATRNHGRASALAFAQEGAHLLICTRRSMDSLEETASMAATSDVRVVTERCDVTDEGQVNALVQKGLKEFGRIDVVVNNAGCGSQNCGIDPGDPPGARWENFRGANLDSSYFVSAHSLPHLVRNEGVGLLHARIEDGNHLACPGEVKPPGLGPGVRETLGGIPADERDALPEMRPPDRVLDDTHHIR